MKSIWVGGGEGVYDFTLSSDSKKILKVAYLVEGMNSQ